VERKHFLTAQCGSGVIQKVASSSRKEPELPAPTQPTNGSRMLPLLVDTFLNYTHIAGQPYILKREIRCQELRTAPLPSREFLPQPGPERDRVHLARPIRQRVPPSDYRRERARECCQNIFKARPQRATGKVRMGACPFASPVCKENICDNRTKVVFVSISEFSI